MIILISLQIFSSKKLKLLRFNSVIKGSKIFLNAYLFITINKTALENSLNFQYLISEWLKMCSVLDKQLINGLLRSKLHWTAHFLTNVRCDLKCTMPKDQFCVLSVFSNTVQLTSPSINLLQEKCSEMLKLYSAVVCYKQLYTPGVGINQKSNQKKSYFAVFINTSSYLVPYFNWPRVFKKLIWTHNTHIISK